jgi:hypothetical protein
LDHFLSFNWITSVLLIKILSSLYVLDSPLSDD